MKTNEALGQINTPEFLDKIYSFAYRRCNTSFEAEDLCSDIILAVIGAIKKRESKQEYIENFYAFVWTVAHRVYADHCQKQNKRNSNISLENCDFAIADRKNEIDEFAESEEERAQLKRIFTEISFLSKIYRDVMVMYYIDEMKIKDIAAKLNISETTVKQRLFSARNTVKKEVEKMDNRNLSLKPISFKYVGTGSPGGNDPSVNARRLLSQNLIYLCKNKAKSAKELSEELCVPMPFIEEELEIQCKGQNGEYGMLRRLENGKYITNVIVADYEEAVAAAKIYEKYLPECCDIIKAKISENKENILSFPYLNEQKDISFILWLLITNMAYNIQSQVQNVLKEKYFAGIEFSNRPYTQTATAYTQEQMDANNGRVGYGCDGIHAYEIGGYKRIFMSNIYGPDMPPHFNCGHNISTDDIILLTIRAIGGLDVNELTDAEKEIAAKAIEKGYLRKNGNSLTPKIVVMNNVNNKEFYQFANLGDSALQIAEQIAQELSEFIKAHLPEHLMGDCLFYSNLIASFRATAVIIQACIKEGILCDPQTPGAGVELIVAK